MTFICSEKINENKYPYQQIESGQFEIFHPDNQRHNIVPRKRKDCKTTQRLMQTLQRQRSKYPERRHIDQKQDRVGEQGRQALSGKFFAGKHGAKIGINVISLKIRKILF